MRSILCGFVASALIFGLPQAQLPGQDTDSTNKTESLEKDFRELIIQHALDFDSAVHAKAISIVQSRNYSDQRIDDLIRREMKTKAGPETRTNRKGIAVALMPHSTLSEKEQVALLLDELATENNSYVFYSDERSGIGIREFTGVRPDIKPLIDRLRDLRDQFIKQLGSRLEDDQPLAIYCALSARVGGAGESLVPQLLKAAKTGGGAVQYAAISSADEILTATGRLRMDAEEVARRSRETDDKLLKYADRIISRYDANDDGVLEPSEWEKMLMSPKPADKDNDNRITVEEYALFMQARMGK